MKLSLSLVLILTFLLYKDLTAQFTKLPSSDESYSKHESGISSSALYTGRLVTSIPLYNVSLTDFSLPVTFSYSENGFIPSNKSYGWKFLVGGKITRQVQGLPDDLKSYTHIIDVNTRETVTVDNPGFLYRGEMVEEIYNLPDEEFVDHENILTRITAVGSDRLIDLYPDEFSFDIHGIASGKFFFDNDMKIRITSDVIGLLIIPEFDSNEEISAFKIVDAEGNSYLFNIVSKNSYVRSLERLQDYMYENEERYGFPFGRYYGRNFFEASWYNEVITDPITYNSKWHLSQIVTINGQTINFDYNIDSEKRTEKYIRNYYYSPNDDGDLIHSEENDRTYLFENRIIEDRSLKSITWSDKILLVGFDGSTGTNLDHTFISISSGGSYNVPAIGWRFYSSNHELYFYPSSLEETQTRNNTIERHKLYDWPYKLRSKLDSIVQFSAENIAGSTYLQTRIFEGVETGLTYSFKYYNDSPLPSFEYTTEIDLWGYYNANKSNVVEPIIYSGVPTIYEVPATVSDPNEYAFLSLFNNENNSLDVLIDGADRSSNVEHSKLGMLKEISFPEGGYKRFEYELNEFYAYNKTIQGGGLRVKSIDICNVDGSCNKENYYYTDEFGKSSGRILALPSFVDRKGHSYFVNSEKRHDFMHTKNGYVGYNEVRIVKEDGNNGTEILIFDLPATIEDPNCVTDDGDIIFEWPLTFLLDGHKNLTTSASFSRPNPPDFDWHRGQLLKHVFKDNTGITVKELEYIYETEILGTVKKVYAEIDNKTPRCSDCHTNSTSGWTYHVTALGRIPIMTVPITVSYSTGGAIFTSRYEQTIGIRRLKEYIEREFNGGVASLAKTTKYDYNYANQLASVSSLGSDGTWTVSKYKFPSDYLPESINEDQLNHNESVLYAMFKRNMIGKPLEIVNYVGNNVIGGEFTYYETFPYAKYFYQITDDILISPKCIYKLVIDNPIIKEEFSESQIFNLPEIFIDPNYTPSKWFDNYDDNGNLLQFHNKNDYSISLIWESDKSKPIAKILNSAINQVAYSGFEQIITANGTSSQLLGNWRIMGGPAWYRALQSKAGKYALGTSSGGSLIKTANLVEPGRYMVTLWATTSSITFQPPPMWSNITYSGNTWYFHEAEIELTNPDEIEVLISGIIDELRLYPSESHITTYSYDSFGNVLTINDNNNIMQHYDYDGLGRLIRVRDNDYNIIQQYEYNYATENE